MSLADAIMRHGRLTPPVVPELRYIQSAVRRVHERWPEVDVVPDDKDRDALAERLKDCLRRNDWRDIRLSFITSAAHAVFDRTRGDRKDLEEARAFLVDETRVSTLQSYLAGMVSVYLETYRPDHPNSRALASALKAARTHLSSSWRALFDAYPQLLEAQDGPKRLAEELIDKDFAFNTLIKAGLRNPHGIGFMEHVHQAMTQHVRPSLDQPNAIEWYLRWLHPQGKDPLKTGATFALEALLSPWRNQTPADDIRANLVEKMIEMYGDPRIQSGGAWATVSADCMAVMHRWLTREDMRFFTGVVDATQKDPMWTKRRDFWLKLYDEELIDAAWVAFSNSAAAYAREHLRQGSVVDVEMRFGWQAAGGARVNTSLLILKIGNKIVVEGCHNYKTHVFHMDDPMAPKLFQPAYDCEHIRKRSPLSQSHSSISSWSRWVRDKINADVPFSAIHRPYPPIRVKPRQYQQPSHSSHSHRSQPVSMPPPPAAGQQAQSDQLRAQQTYSRGVSQPQPLSAPTPRHSAPPQPRSTPKPTVQPSSLEVWHHYPRADRLTAQGPDTARYILTKASASEELQAWMTPLARYGLQQLIKGRALEMAPKRNLEQLLLHMETDQPSSEPHLWKTVAIDMKANPEEQDDPIAKLRASGEHGIERIIRYARASTAINSLMRPLAKMALDSLARGEGISDLAEQELRSFISRIDALGYSFDEILGLRKDTGKSSSEAEKHIDGAPPTNADAHRIAEQCLEDMLQDGGYLARRVLDYAGSLSGRFLSPKSSTALSTLSEKSGSISRDKENAIVYLLKQLIARGHDIDELRAKARHDATGVTDMTGKDDNRLDEDRVLKIGMENLDKIMGLDSNIKQTRIEFLERRKEMLGLSRSFKRFSQNPELQSALTKLSHGQMDLTDEDHAELARLCNALRVLKVVGEDGS